MSTQRRTTPPPPGKGRRRISILPWLALLALAVFLFQAMGPGGSPLAKWIGGAPGEGPSGADGPVAPAPAEGDAVPPPPAPPGGTSAPDAGTDGFSVSVRLADGAAKGARVAVFVDAGEGAPRRAPQEGVVDGEGRMRVGALPPSWVSLRVEASLGPLRGEVTLDRETGGPVKEVELRLPGTFVLGGVVSAAEDGRPLEGMRVRLGEGVAGATTDRLGRFRVENLSASLLKGDLPPLTVTGEGRAPVTRTLSAADSLDDLLISMEKP